MTPRVVDLQMEIMEGEFFSVVLSLGRLVGGSVSVFIFSGICGAAAPNPCWNYSVVLFTPLNVLSGMGLTRPTKN